MSAAAPPDRPADGTVTTAGRAAGGMAGGASGDAERLRAALRAEIEQTRAALGETVGALAAKADVKARAQERVGEVRVRAQGRASEVYSDVAYWIGRSRERISGSPGARLPLLAGAAGLAVLLAGLSAAALHRRAHGRSGQVLGVRRRRGGRSR